MKTNIINSKHLSVYEAKKAHLLEKFKASGNSQIRVKKKTASNLFRYIYKDSQPKEAISIEAFDNILSLDTTNHILNVEGLSTYEKIVSFTLQYGYLPLVTPELKHITIGGAIVGIGIESTGYKYGFVHDGLLEVEVLLPDGQIVLCNPHNEYADLFFALPNSYGTLGYILRAKIKLQVVKPFVKMTITRFTEPSLYVDAMFSATKLPEMHFIEGLVFSKNELYLMCSQFVDTTEHVSDIYRSNIFYKLIQHQKEIYLKTEDYIFRYDPDWFWNIPETFIYHLFRKISPKSWRNSGIYKKYLDAKNKILSKFKLNSSLVKEEALIQDWEVPWEKGSQLLLFALNNIDLLGKPWAIIPIQSIVPATLYPLKPETLYFNLGCYCYSKTPEGKQDRFYNTKIMDAYCFSHAGLKMLYSSTFLSKDQFNALYNGKAYQELKNKYDPLNSLGNLYDKAVSVTE